jgi:hypothetical protein
MFQMMQVTTRQLTCRTGTDWDDRNIWYGKRPDYSQLELDIPLSVWLWPYNLNVTENNAISRNPYLRWIQSRRGLVDATPTFQPIYPSREGVKLVAFWGFVITLLFLCCKFVTLCTWKLTGCELVLYVNAVALRIMHVRQACLNSMPSCHKRFQLVMTCPETAFMTLCPSRCSCTGMHIDACKRGRKKV